MITGKSEIFVLLALTISVQAISTKDPLQTVPRVDLSRYLGKWYEIARYPNRFQRNCLGKVNAEYALRQDGKITVINSCKKKNGDHTQFRGIAKVVDPSTNSKLRVTFFWPFYGDYWILDLAPDYSYAIIGEPKRRYLWILSRTPKMDPVLYESLLQKVAQIGYDPRRLIKTPQSDPA